MVKYSIRVWKLTLYIVVGIKKTWILTWYIYNWYGQIGIWIKQNWDVIYIHFEAADKTIHICVLRDVVNQVVMFPSHVSMLFFPNCWNLNVIRKPEALATVSQNEMIKIIAFKALCWNVEYIITRNAWPFTAVQHPRTINMIIMDALCAKRLSYNGCVISLRVFNSVCSWYDGIDLIERLLSQKVMINDHFLM